MVCRLLRCGQASGSRPRGSAAVSDVDERQDCSSGLGQLEGAQVSTQRQGGNPDLWQDVMQRWPLLQESKYYKKTRYGYARGKEAVTLVQNIRHYYSILVWQDIPDNQPTPPLHSEDYFPKGINNFRLQTF